MIEREESLLEDTSEEFRLPTRVFTKSSQVKLLINHVFGPVTNLAMASDIKTTHDNNAHCCVQY